MATRVAAITSRQVVTDFLVDTDWVVDYLNGQPDAAELFASLADAGIGISIVTYAELYEGVLGASDPAGRLAQLETFAESVDLLAFDAGAAREFARIRRTLRQLGQPIPDMDALIAATALSNDATLVTRDQHFNRVPDLKLTSS